MSDPTKDLDASTVASRGRAKIGTRVRRFRLRVTEGPDLGTELVIDESLPPRALLGTSPACELKLSDRQVSRRHVAFALVGSKLRVIDQVSTNGTFVNGVLVNDATLLGGESIKVGSTTLLAVADTNDSFVPMEPATAFGRLLGGSDAMRRLFPTLERIASSNVPVVIEGETGTGKEVCAEAIHAKSPRAAQPFVVFDCTAVTSNLIESALFGHERGAFTGAVDTRKGVFEQAEGGTLLIDEIGDLDRGLQAKLLRAIERGEVQRVGGDKWIATDVRVLAATRRNLDAEVQAGRFRDDLFFRLMVARVELPPLRERPDDIELLARAFWQESGGPGDLPQELIDEWRGGLWPGNVRELHNAVARLVALGDSQPPAPLRTGTEGASAAGDPIERVLARKLTLSAARETILREFERRYIERVMADEGGNVTRAAKAAGVAHRYFQLLRAKLEK